MSVTAELKEQLQVVELAEAESALSAAEAAHAAIFAQCAEQQQLCDSLDARHWDLLHEFNAADRQRAGARNAIDNHHLNARANPDRRYASIDEQRRTVVDLRGELETAERHYGEASNRIMQLQHERRAAKQVLSDLSFRERTAAGVLAGARERVAELTPPAPINATDAHMPQLDGATIVYSSGGVRPANPATRRAATRGRADRH